MSSAPSTLYQRRLDLYSQYMMMSNLGIPSLDKGQSFLALPEEHVLARWPAGVTRKMCLRNILRSDMLL